MPKKQGYPKDKKPSRVKALPPGKMMKNDKMVDKGKYGKSVESFGKTVPKKKPKQR